MRYISPAACVYSAAHTSYTRRIFCPGSLLSQLPLVSLVAFLFQENNGVQEVGQARRAYSIRKRFLACFELRPVK